MITVKKQGVKMPSTTRNSRMKINTSIPAKKPMGTKTKSSCNCGKK